MLLSGLSGWPGWTVSVGVLARLDTSWPACTTGSCLTGRQGQCRPDVCKASVAGKARLQMPRHALHVPQRLCHPLGPASGAGRAQLGLVGGHSADLKGTARQEGREGDREFSGWDADRLLNEQP